MILQDTYEVKKADRLKQEFFIKVKDTKLLSFKKYIDCYHLMRR